jgi:F-type H+-transporting ATPase subunit a
LLRFSLSTIEVGSSLDWVFLGLPTIHTKIAGLAITGRFLGLTTVHGQVLLVTWFVIALVLDFARRCYPRKDDSYRYPQGELKSFAEMLFLYVSGITKDQIGKDEYLSWVPFVGTLFIFIFVANWMGALVPWKIIRLQESELAAPTNDINTTVAMSLLVSISYFYAGLKSKGIGFFARYSSPEIIFLPINVLEDFTKPLSLSFRLFGNILADEIVVSVLCALVPIFIPLPVMVLGLFASSVQALVFATLSAAYIGESIE